MRALAAFIMESRLRAVTAASGLTAAGIVLPPVSILGGATMALIGLRLGAKQALTVMAASAAVLGALLWFAAGSPAPVAVIVVAQWLPVIGLALVLRGTSSWASTIQVGAAVAGMTVVVVHAVVPDLSSAWLVLLEQIFGPIFAQSGMEPGDVEVMLAGMAPLMTGITAAGAFLGLVLALVAGRYWQALLYNPGGFGAEFQAINLGRPAAMTLVALLALAWIGGITVAGELAIVLAVAFFLQGVALAHDICRRRAMSQWWLVGMYVLLVPAMPQMTALLVAFGAVDGVADLRRRVGSSSDS